MYVYANGMIWTIRSLFSTSHAQIAKTYMRRFLNRRQWNAWNPKWVTKQSILFIRTLQFWLFNILCKVHAPISYNGQRPVANMTVTVAVSSGSYLHSKSDKIYQQESHIPQVKAMGRRHAIVQQSEASLALGYGPLTKRKLMLPSLNSSSKGQLVQRTTWLLCRHEDF